MLSGSIIQASRLQSAINPFTSALASLDSGEPADTASPTVSPPTSKLQPVERKRSKSPLGKEKDEGTQGSTS